MDNLRPLLWLTLVFILFLMWQAWNADYGQPRVPVTAAPESTQQAPVDTVPEDVPEARTIADAPSDPALPPDIAPPLDTHLITVRSDVLDLRIDPRGGTLVQADLLAYPVSLRDPDNPVRLLDQRTRGYVAQSGLTHDRRDGQDQAHRAPSHHAVFTPARSHFELGSGQQELRVPMTWVSNDGEIEVVKTFILERGSHLVRVEHEIINRGSDTWIGRQYRQLRHGSTPSRESWFLYTFTGAAYFDGRYNKESFESFVDSPVNLPALEGGWISIIQHYFMSAWIPGADEVNSLYSRAVAGPRGTEYLIGLHSADPLVVAPGSSDRFQTQIWMGPKIQSELSEIARGLELTVDYGIFTFLSKPLFWLLRVIHNVVGNWGWAIVLLTIVIKLAFFHLSATSYRSMAKMRAVAPKLQALKERFKDDKQRMNTALMELYKKEKINPLGGCLPILIQIPVFIALYWVLLESVEMRQAPWMLWIQDLSTRDPLFILPILMGLTMFIQYKLNPPPMDPIQQKIFMALPFVFTIFFAFFPAGLVLYWFTNNLFSIAQQYVITRKIDAEMAKKT
jgi:YidC/Oxa1 family membrane protein insertase